jgi:uncharacterized protein YqgC (DUF456 family)
VWAFWIALLAMIIGLCGIVVPILPDIALIWFVILVWAIAERFTAIDPVTFMALTFLGALGSSADFWMSQAGAKIGGASIRSLFVGLALGAVGAAVGLVFLGIGAVPGAVLGALVGLVLTEWYRRKDWRGTLKVVGGWLIGYILSVGVQLSIGILMIFIFVWQVLTG